jgi:hypothetical protein
MDSDQERVRRERFMPAERTIAAREYDNETAKHLLLIRAQVNETKARAA